MQHGDAVVRTVSSQQEGPGFNYWGGEAFLCVCMCGFPPGPPISPAIKNMYHRLIIQSMSMTKSTYECLDLVPLLLRRGWVKCREQISPYIMYVANKVSSSSSSSSSVHSDIPLPSFDYLLCNKRGFSPSGSWKSYLKVWFYFGRLFDQTLVLVKNKTKTCQRFFLFL